jgi:hypothetical protein
MTTTVTTVLPKRMFPELDTLSENKTQKVNQFYEQVWLPFSKDHPKWPTCYKILSEEESRLWSYKFMVARKFDQEEAKKMLEAVLDFRSDYKTEDRPYFYPAVPLKGYDVDAVMKFFGQEKPREQNEEWDRIFEKTKIWQSMCYHKYDKWGHPVSFECQGRQHSYFVPYTLKRLVTNPASGENYTDVAMKYHVHAVEVGLKLTRYQDQVWAKDKVEAPTDETSSASDKNNDDSTPPKRARVAGVLCICDMTGLSMSHFVNEYIAYLSRFGDFDKKVYPEGLHHVLVINCPALIRMAFAIVSPLIDARTQQKISFHAPGDATAAALRNWLHEEDIPQYLGGKCNCPGGCVNVPDWNVQEAEYAAMVKKAKDGGEVEDGVAQAGIEVPAGKNFSREIAIKKDEGLSWDWLSEEERTIEFSVQFQATTTTADQPNNSPVETIIAPDKITKHSGTHIATADGKVKLVFGNEFSWLRSKYLTICTSVFTAPKSSSIDIDGEKKEEVEEEETTKKTEGEN